MTSRMRTLRSHRLMLSVEAPPGLSEEDIKKILADVLGPKSTVTVEPPKPKKVRAAKLVNRNLRHEGRYPCRRTPDPLWAAAIIWPIGVPHEGCGRTYGSEAMRDAHEAGFSDSKRTKRWNERGRFPHDCLDAIVPANLRDTR